MKYFRPRGLKAALLRGPAAVDEPISAEIYSIERLELYASTLAKTQEISHANSSAISLQSRLRANSAVLNSAYQTLLAGIRGSKAVTPAAEWLLDNYYVVDEHIRAIRRDLPAEYYRQLPKLANGHLLGYPRVYGIAWSIIAHTDNRFELETLYRFCRAYQRVQPLTIGELWAIAITLRVVLIDNLSRLAAGIVYRLKLRENADALADALLSDVEDPAPTLADLRKAETAPLPNAFAAQLFQRLRDQDPEKTPGLSWLHTTLAAQNTTADDIVHGEHQRQGAVNVSVRNVITSLRLISSVDWAKFFESVSLVDELMRDESAYGSFDFSTRDLYRHAIEDLARHSRHSEINIARRAVDAARRAMRTSNSGTGDACREHEPGYYIVAEGRQELERELAYAVPWNQRLARWTRAAGIGGYVCSITALSALATGVCFRFAGTPSQAAPLAVIIIGLALLAASDAATAVVNLWVTHICRPRPLPGLELTDGVPPELRTIVALPVLLTSIADIDARVRSLEVHYLATQDGDIHFALVSDWLDADAESEAADEHLLATAAAGIARLNRLHGNVHGTDRFLLLHRKRQWNPAEGRWMGWERKRGKLHELNRLLLGALDTSFIAIDGELPRVPSGVRYVISLDADTRLPRGAALALIGKMAHPLNRPVVGARAGRVTAGYGILQPRVTPALAIGLESSIFQSVFSGPSGIDPYAFAVSDVYQDMFGEGSYTGKGIYDVGVFEATLDGRVGDNRLLSHDLFEGIYARCGLASDVEVVEEYPSRYDVATARQHRWTRGDWQLLPWILGLHGAVPALGRWKMLDNLRRSLQFPGCVAALVLSWLGPAPLGWTLFLLAAMIFPVVIPLGVRLAPRFADLSSRGYLGAARSDLKTSLSLLALRLVFWADGAWIMSDAIWRALYRMTVSRRHLLEWTATAQSKAGASSSWYGAYRRMGGGVLLCVAIATLLTASPHGFTWIAAPFLLAWICAPAVARRVSKPAPAVRLEPLTAADRHAFRMMARQTWSFFDTFVTGRHNMLPPDNFQEVPNAVVANRTSPTNIGLYLLSVVAARDFGWIGSLDSMERLEATFSTLEKLEKYRGHLYNWYDTHDLRPLDPKYISTVDSGNLAGHLVAIEVACRDWIAKPIPAAACMNGIEDTLEHLQRVARALTDDRRNYGISPRQLDAAVEAFRTALRGVRNRPGEMAQNLATLRISAGNIGDIARALIEERGDGENAPLLKWSEMLLAGIASHARDAGAAHAAAAGAGAGDDGRQDFGIRAAALARKARAFALSMEFGFLVEPDRKLLSIGYRVAERLPDPSCYDLLASEARLASFFAIAKGDLPVRHWFRLGRLLTPVDRSSALVSWSGSMFEYLMPVLVMREPDGSVLGDTARLVVRRQIQYGVERGLPWGVSESAFNARDRELTYQYSSFGVPGLGLQRGLGDEAVVAPYATALAAMIDPKAAIRNFGYLEKLGGRGRYGWYDALDFTPARLPEGKDVVPVRAYMAHHQGMILVAIANVLKGGVLQNLFHGDSMIQATELLLQERTPRDADRSPPGFDYLPSSAESRDLPAAVPRRFTSPHHVAPRTHLLSNGNYSVMITAAGSGYSRWRDIAVTRWREDPTCDAWGSYVFLRDVANGQVWSAGYQPVGREPDGYQVAFFEDRAEITRRDGPIITSTEIVVSPEDDAEVRRVSITNMGNRVREIELTTYAEVVLTTPDADSAHPAFAKLFVRTEFVPGAGTLLATRRNREPGEQELWAAHVCVLEGEAVGGLQFETDRARFLGRGNDLRNAVSIVDARPLSNTTGTVLDPVLALRRRVRVPPGETVHVAFWTILAQTRAQALSLADKHRDTAAFDRAKTLAWTQAQVQLRYLGVDFEEAQQFQRIANRVLYADASLRASREILGKNRSGPSALWTFGVSGDIPIVLIRIDDENDLEIVKQLLRAHEYWRLKRLAVDLVILNDRPPSYASDLQQAIDSAIRTSLSRGQHEEESRRGSVFSLRGDLMPASSSDFLQTAARAVFVARRGTLGDQLARLREPDPAPRVQLQGPTPLSRAESSMSMPALEYFNGLGGFAAAGREYITVLDEGQRTPAPWINVIANPQFGFQVSADGAGSTWSLNARENQLTPWSNDPVSDPPSEVIYIRDEDSGDVWSATPLPIRRPTASYAVHHGFGYTRFEHLSHGIALDLVMFVPLADAVKISRMKLVNRSASARRLSVTHYVDWVLGNQRSRTAPFIITEVEPKTSALLARNPWRTEFQSRVAFLDTGGRQQTCTGDRAEFVGRHGSLSEPAALLAGNRLSNRVGGGLDPCGALQSALTLRPGEEVELVFMLGEAESTDSAVALIERYRGVDLEEVFNSVTDYWGQTLGAIQVKTPDRTVDILLNGWLLYQTLVCRVWGRAGFYQSSGAYGYRDQLQDVMALCISRPAIAREHILRAAARQFAAGDVQHWWLPTSGQGVKTRVSDDRVWLPFVVSHYLDVTEDLAVLDELLPFLEGPPLGADQHEIFGSPAPTAETATLFEHCVRALDGSLAIGSHGLPLFGAGDWNDGMNRVGAAGRGESVWLGWFLHSTLLKFGAVAERRGEASKAAQWRKDAYAIQQAIEREAWDGDWYRRGYFDDGSPLGSVSSEECRIDAIAQSWGVISGGAEAERAARAMSAVNAQLVSRSDGLVKLFTPPFDRGTHDPGYIQAYPPGLRENGGQYTHAAMWTTLAFAMMGDGDRAGELFSLLNPINHASTRAGIHRYKVEPYVVCADVYSAESHVGRGGWTWYTGSAAWMYRTAVEGILGINLRGNFLSINPCIPRAWSGFEITYKHGSSRYHIAVENPNGVCRGIVRATTDNREISTSNCGITLVDDGTYHYARITLG
ncbi:MAG: cyclic beta,2-glucan synthetase [Gammaproteobacteria bacterium]|nr:cyclic beta,2-glucan synthetase [Gammaproteobacteria bacterium]